MGEAEGLAHLGKTLPLFSLSPLAYKVGDVTVSLGYTSKYRNSESAFPKPAWISRVNLFKVPFSKPSSRTLTQYPEVGAVSTHHHNVCSLTVAPW